MRTFRWASSELRDENPYKLAKGASGLNSIADRDRRWLFLFLPPLIPLIVHGVARFYISPGGRPPYLGFITLGAIIPAWMWAQFMVDRFRFSFWKTCAVTWVVWGAVVGVAISSVVISDFLHGSL